MTTLIFVVDGCPKHSFWDLFHFKTQYFSLQVITIYVLLEEMIGKEEPTTSQIYVFRVRDKEGSWKFLDCALRTYDDFEDYIKNNKAPRCMMCYPTGGFLRSQEMRDKKGKTYTSGEVRFGEPPSCTLTGRVVEKLDTVNMYVTPVVAITLFWTPAGWVATGLSALSYTTLGYSLVRQAFNIYDKGTHGEHYATDLFNFATTIATLAVARAIPKYLRTVALQNRQLTFLESVIITGILRGMAASTAVNFAALVYQFGYKLVNQRAEISAMDVVNLMVAAQNMYSCYMSPKSAKAILEKVKVEIQTENQAKRIEKENSIKKAQESNKELEQKLREMRESGNEDRVITDTLEKKIQANNKNIETWTKEAQVALEKFMENQRNWAEADVKEALAPIKEIQDKMSNIRSENESMERELEELNSSESGNRQRIEELRNKIASNKEKIANLTSDALAKQNEYLKQKGDKMKASLFLSLHYFSKYRTMLSSDTFCIHFKRDDYLEGALRLYIH
ncbi:hypothetical protein NECAME_08801 [Necator americanus]|uniref:DUF4781 domain-containing protein n=1 Tax=Necator americanus TaxID=51031 RepID=W2THC1_NECAM|nr:hypothetical protein NECAME_08801 [Necator americanus]ETN80999.1 hypothetical protein NECAME_08801 [Necator americanus]